MGCVRPCSRGHLATLAVATLSFLAHEAAAQDAPLPPASAAALSAPPPVAPPPRAPPTVTNEHPLAFRADLKLPFAVATSSTSQLGASGLVAPVSQLVLGIHYGRIGAGVGVGFSRLAFTTTNVTTAGSSSSSQSDTEILIAPTLTVDAFQSEDGEVALYLLGAPILGTILVTNQSDESDFGFQVAVGANVALHDNLRLGMEVGPVGHFYGGGSTGASSVITMYTALVATFAYPR
jgi:hypothetical protein